MSTFTWIILASFLLALIGGLVRKLRKDPCLKFLTGGHVTFLGSEGRAVWGDMYLTSQGMELSFDAPHVDERKLNECGVTIFPPEISGMIALCRNAHGMTERERARRERQVWRVLHPTQLARWKRSVSNVGGMVRDAVVESLGLAIGHLTTAKSKPVTALADRQRQVSEVGGALMDLGARAYEPLLERHIGKPVIAKIDIPGPKARPVHFPGYLAEYNEKFLVIVNDSQDAEESVSVRPSEEGRANGCVSLIRSGNRVEITCTCDDALIVKRMVGRRRTLDLGAILLPESKLSMHVPADFELEHVEVDRTRRLDLVCARARAQVRFSSTRPPIQRHSWHGVSPG